MHAVLLLVPDSPNSLCWIPHPYPSSTSAFERGKAPDIKMTRASPCCLVSESWWVSPQPWTRTRRSSSPSSQSQNSSARCGRINEPVPPHRPSLKVVPKHMPKSSVSSCDVSNDTQSPTCLMSPSHGCSCSRGPRSARPPRHTASRARA